MTNPPLFLLLLVACEDPDKDDKVVRVVTLLLPLLFDLKLNPLFALWYELVLLFLNSPGWLLPLLLMFRCAVLWEDSLRVKLSERDELVAVFALPIFSLLFLKMSDNLCVTVGCRTAVVWWRLKSSIALSFN